MKIAPLAVLCACFSSGEAPNLIRIVREGGLQPEVHGAVPVNVIGMSAIAGPGESWQIELHDSFASIEDLDQAFHAAGFLGFPNPSSSGDGILPSSGIWVARHRPGLSYRPEQAILNLAKARYLDVTVYRIPPGGQSEFVRGQRLREYSLDITNADRPDMAYEVVAGAPSGTYISLTPLTSLRSLDEGRPPTPYYAEGTVAAARNFARNMEVLRERLWFRMEPRLSSVSQEFASPDAAFWHPKTQ